MARAPISRGPRGAAAPAKAERLHKVLARSGLGSLRELEQLIAAGRVKVNGAVAPVGCSVGPGDRVHLNGRLVRLNFTERAPRVIVYHKPEGEIVSRDDPEGRVSVFAKVPPLSRGRWLAVGRLDFNTSGLLLFTTSGELANRLMHPRYQVEREYSVRVMGMLDETALERLRQGVELEDGPAHFEALEEAGGEGSNRWYRVMVKEGRNRLVRRLFESASVTVSRLMRVRLGPVALPPRLKRGMWQELEGEALADLLRFTGLQSAAAERQRPSRRPGAREDRPHRSTGAAPRQKRPASKTRK